MRASVPTGFQHPRKGRHTGRPLRPPGQRVAAAQPLVALPLTDAAYSLRVKRNARKEKLVKCVLAPRRCRHHPARDGSCKLAEDHSVPEGRAKSALAPIRRPPYSNFARTCKVAAKAFFLFGPCNRAAVGGSAALRMRHTPCGYGPFLFWQDQIWGPRRAPRGGERRSKGGGAVFALGPPPRPAWWGEPEQRSERVLASMAGTRDAKLVTARETELSGLCDDDNGGCIGTSRQPGWIPASNGTHPLISSGRNTARNSPREFGHTSR